MLRSLSSSSFSDTLRISTAQHLWNDKLKGKPTYSEKKTGPSTTLSTTNPTWHSLGSTVLKRGHVEFRINNDLVLLNSILHYFFSLT